MQRFRYLAAALLVVVSSAACTLPRLSNDGAPDATERRATTAPVVAPAPEAARPAGESARAVASQAQPAESGERLVIQTANVTLLVEDVRATVDRARSLATSLGGFVVSASQREDRGQPAATVTIRVPAERFDEALASLEALAVRLVSEQIGSKDVTEEFVDTDARLRNLRATEARLLDLLQQAKSVEDVLKVEQQLTTIRGQIEQLQGRLQYLQRSSQLATITLDIQPYGSARGPAAIDWNPLPIVRGAWTALLTVLQLLIAASIWVAVFAPLWLPVGLLLRRWWRRQSARAVVT